MSKGLVTVFGGSGFVGKHVVRALVKDGWRVRVPVRRPHTAQELRVIGNVGQVQLVQANVRFKNSVIRAVEGSDAVVNLVAVLFEEGRQSFAALNEVGAATIAEAAREAGVRNFVQMSALGADENGESEYARSRAGGEKAVHAALPTADILRPSIIFGAEDNFFNQFASLSQISPALPLIGGGKTAFQPVYAGDIAQAVAKVLNRGTSGDIYELGGPQTYSFRELLDITLKTVDRKRFLVPVPWFSANMLGFVGELIGWLPFVKPFLTRDQVTMLKSDNIVSDTAKGFQELDIELETIEAIIPTYLGRYRKYGQFHQSRA